MAIKEVQDLKTLKLDDLIRKLLTCKIHLQEESDKQVPKQAIGLKSTNDGIKTRNEEFDDEEDKTITMIISRIKQIFQMHLEF